MKINIKVCADKTHAAVTITHNDTEISFGLLDRDGCFDLAFDLAYELQETAKELSYELS